MSFSFTKNSIVLKNGYNLTDYLTSISIDRAIAELQTTTLGKEDETYIPGIKTATLTGEGLYDGDANAVDEVLNASEDSLSNIWTIFPDGDTAGNRGKALEGIRTSYNINTSFTDLVKISLSGRGNAAKANLPIVSILAHSTVTTTTNSASVDNGASSADGGYAILNATAITGTVTVILEDSANDADWSTLATFTDVSAIGAEIVAIAGTIERYVRATLTLDGGESITVQLSLHRA